MNILVCIFGFVLPALAEERITFERFLNLAREQSLEIKIRSAKAHEFAASAKALNIPPPMVGYMRMRDQSGSSADGFEVSQTLPFPRKLINERSARNLDAKTHEETTLAAQSEVRAKAKAVYFSLWACAEKVEALKEKMHAIEAHIRLARAGVRSDSSLRIHLLKAESDLDLTENDLLQAEQDVLDHQAMAASFLDMEATKFHPAVTEPPITAIPDEALLDQPHQIEVARLNLESFRAQESAAKSSWFPDLNLRYKQIGQTEMMPSTSELMIGVSLPFVFPWDVSANVERASAARMEAELGVETETRKIESDKTSKLSKAKALKKQIDNIYLRLLPRAERRMRLVQNLAPRDMESLVDHRETMEAFPELKLKALDLRQAYEDVVSELLKYARSESR